MDIELEYIRFILLTAQESGHKLVPIRLIKFLYLADYFSTKELNKRVTDWDWLFWDFGPFTKSALESIDKASKIGLLGKTKLPSKFDEISDYILFETGVSYEDLETEIAKTSKRIPVQVQISLKELIRKYGSDTNGLLDFTYFKTEPMVNASPRSSLKFTYNPIFTKPMEKKTELSAKKMKKAKDVLARLKSKYIALPQRDFSSQNVDIDYFEGVKELFGEESSTESLDGLTAIASIATLGK